MKEQYDLSTGELNRESITGVPERERQASGRCHRASSSVGGLTSEDNVDLGLIQSQWPLKIRFQSLERPRPDGLGRARADRSSVASAKREEPVQSGCQGREQKRVSSTVPQFCALELGVGLLALFERRVRLLLVLGSPKPDEGERTLEPALGVAENLTGSVTKNKTTVLVHDGRLNAGKT